MIATVEHQLQHGPAGDAAALLEAEGILRRRHALSIFLHDPDEAAKSFPDLLESLRIFLTFSTNPFADIADDCTPKLGSEELFDEWHRAVEWFGGHHTQGKDI